jgi:hypothetical protein
MEILVPLASSSLQSRPARSARVFIKALVSTSARGKHLTVVGAFHQLYRGPATAKCLATAPAICIHIPQNFSLQVC